MKISNDKVAMVVCKEYKTFQNVFDTGDYEDVISYHEAADLPIEEMTNMMNHLKRHIKVVSKPDEVDQLVVILDDYYYPKMAPLVNLTPEMGPVTFGRWNSKKKKFTKTGYLA